MLDWAALLIASSILLLKLSTSAVIKTEIINVRLLSLYNSIDNYNNVNVYTVLILLPVSEVELSSWNTCRFTVEWLVVCNNCRKVTDEDK